MSHTVRAYNKHPLRLGPGYCGWIVSNRISEQDLFRFQVGDYHPWQQWGFMKGWKDWRLRSRRRQAWKAEISRELSDYMAWLEFDQESLIDNLTPYQRENHREMVEDMTGRKFA